MKKGPMKSSKVIRNSDTTKKYAHGAGARKQ